MSVEVQGEVPWSHNKNVRLLHGLMNYERVIGPHFVSRYTSCYAM